MLKLGLKERIDKAIKDNPSDNVWETYEAGKREIKKCQEQGLYDINWEKYNEIIKYISAKLGI